MPLRRPVAAQGDRGSIIPLVLGFWLIALLFVAGAVALGDVFTKQRNLQSVCDGAAIAAANTVRADALHGGGVAAGAIPIGDAAGAVAAYLGRDRSRSTVSAQTEIEADGVTVALTCAQHNEIAFGIVVGKAHGVDQVVAASARSPLTP